MPRSIPAKVEPFAGPQFTPDHDTASDVGPVDVHDLELDEAIVQK